MANIKFTPPTLLSLELIDEDPNQPRKDDNPGFRVSSLRELANTIIERGVKTPISVRKHPTDNARYMINHGHRRYRAALLAGLTEIPAYLDEDHTRVDQVIENLQRDGLTAREITDFIAEQLNNGWKKKDIAKALGKTNDFVTLHLALLDMPVPIAKLVNTGKMSDVRAIYELCKLYKIAPKQVEESLSGEIEIGLKEVRFAAKVAQKLAQKGQNRNYNTVFSALKEEETKEDLEYSTEQSATFENFQNNTQIPDPTSSLYPQITMTSDNAKSAAEVTLPYIAKKFYERPWIIVESASGKKGRLVVHKIPTEPGLCWIQTAEEEFQAKYSDVKIIEIGEAREIGDLANVK
jgi:ParB family chromosome partitioning protein